MRIRTGVPGSQGHLGPDEGRHVSVAMQVLLPLRETSLIRGLGDFLEKNLKKGETPGRLVRLRIWRDREGAHFEASEGV